MIKNLYYTIDNKYAGHSVEYLLKSQGYSRHLIVRIKQTENGLMVDGIYVFTNYILKEGQTLHVKIVDDVPSENIVHTEMPLNIVFEDDDLLIINKNAGVPIHPSQGNFSNTLANGIAFYFAQKGEPFVYRSINRLDRDTTGLLILAKNPLSGCILSDMVKKREIHREYLAIASGKVPESGTIDAPIARVHDSTIERCVNFENGESARTHFKCIKHNDTNSLVALKLETGRTHQIRVHMKHIGHPLLGDFLYNPDFTKISRQALHSHKLSFNHPITKQPMQFVCDLPQDMSSIL